ncbi:MAG: D-alanyl-D-alanine carboxypeptidase [Kiritimatiellae bacterium]|nr:D-alanyl-D-alanine carboxypeptidase [Kiritimatiellia bacterium]
MKLFAKIFVLVFCSLFAVSQLDAKAPLRTKKSGVKKSAAVAPAKPYSPVRRAPYQGAISFDADTGRILFSDRANEIAYPASVTKLMTLLLVVEDLYKGVYEASDKVTASWRACQEKPSIAGLKPGQQMTVDDLLFTLMVKSANDSAVALAEFSVARNANREIEKGDLEIFIRRMNDKAKELGMTKTNYQTPNGYPPKPGSKKPFDTSTAADLVKLASAVIKYPLVFRYTNKKIVTVTDGAGKPLRFVNHNNILVKNKWKILNKKGESEVDGLKTGYIDMGGSSIILTGKRRGHRAVVIVLGSDRAPMRDENARRLMVEALDAIAGPE